LIPRGHETFGAIETASHHEDMDVGIESQKMTEGQNRDDGAGGVILLQNRLPKTDFQGFPDAQAQISIIPLAVL
jgi:hypothetical protein